MLGCDVEKLPTADLRSLPCPLLHRLTHGQVPRGRFLLLPARAHRGYCRASARPGQGRLGPPPHLLADLDRENSGLGSHPPTEAMTRFTDNPRALTRWLQPQCPRFCTATHLRFVARPSRHCHGRVPLTRLPHLVSVADQHKTSRLCRVPGSEAFPVAEVKGVAPG